MTPAQAGELLATIAIVDNRKPGEREDAIRVAKMWAAALSVHQITPREAEWAVAQHFATSTEWLQPAHITKLVLADRARNARIVEGATPTASLASLSPPPGHDPDDAHGHIEWLRKARADLAAGVEAPPQLGTPRPLALGSIARLPD